MSYQQNPNHNTQNNQFVHPQYQGGHAQYSGGHPQYQGGYPQQYGGGYPQNQFQAFDVESNSYHEDRGSLIAKDVDSGRRKAFISKVYSILMAQMLLTVFMCYLSITSSSYLKFQTQNIGLFYLMIFINIASCCALACSRELAQKVPHNYITLGIFTFSEGYIISIICGLTNPRLVMTAAVLTLGMFLALTLYAWTTKEDFTTLGGMMAVAMFVFAVAGIMMLFTQNNTMHIIYSAIGVIIFGLYIIIDTQMIIGGDRKYTLTIDEYIFAALQLYIDIVQIFLYILEILNRSDN